MRTRLALAVVPVLLALLFVPSALAATDATAEADLVSRLNATRAEAGLAPLTVADDLVAIAREHAVRMADTATLHHNPELGSDVSGWQKVGENVGRGPQVAAIHEAFVASAAHRANLVGPDWTQVGIGVEERDGRLWVTQVFRQPLATAPPAPAAAPEAPTDEVAVAAESVTAPVAAARAPVAAPLAAGGHATLMLARQEAQEQRRALDEVLADG